MLYNIESENAVLGCCLASKGEAVDLVSTIVNADDFFREVNQIIFNIMVEMKTKGESVNILTVLDHVRARVMDMSEEDIRLYLVNLVENSFGMDSIDIRAAEENAYIVKKYSERRNFAQASMKAMSEIKQPEIPLADIKAEFQAKIDKLGVVMGLEWVKDIADYDYDSLTDFRKTAKDKMYSTLPTLDMCFGRFGEAQFILLKAARGSGKTHIMIDLAFMCANFGRVAVIYSLEMPKQQLLKRMIAHEGKFDSAIFRRLESADIDDWSKIHDGYQLLAQKNICIRDEAGMFIETMGAELRNLKLKGFDVGFVGIDFAELVGTKKSYQSKEQQLFDIGTQLRNISSDLKCTVVLLSQINELGGERYSRGLGNLCDLLLKWDCKDDSNMGVFISEKNRFGRKFRFDVAIDKTNSRLKEVTDKYGDLQKMRNRTAEVPTIFD